MHRNHISVLKDYNGNWVSEHNRLGDILLHYFQDLFHSEGANTHHLNQLPIHQISASDYNILNSPFSRKEVKQAVWNLGAWKAPGPDGLPIGFYKENWSLVGNHIMDIVMKCWEGKSSLDHLNDTDLVLIPKSKNLQSPGDFRPIGLCNAIYKIVSKTIANRLALVLPNIIDPCQGAFLKNRGVAPTALTGLELIHHIVYSPLSKDHQLNLAIKLDLSKAFDGVEWSFLLTLMDSLGFPHHLKSFIYHCIRSTRICVKYNQTKISYFHPSRGLRQGDPLSPLLFLLCIQGLFFFINDSFSRNNWQPLKFKKKTCNYHTSCFRG